VENFPEDVKNGILKLGGQLTGPAISFDASETEQVFEVKWIGFEEQIKSIVSQYVELRKAEVARESSK
jgi:hypothetical protein